MHQAFFNSGLNLNAEQYPNFEFLIPQPVPFAYMDKGGSYMTLQKGNPEFIKFPGPTRGEYSFLPIRGIYYPQATQGLLYSPICTNPVQYYTSTLNHTSPDVKNLPLDFGIQSIASTSQQEQQIIPTYEQVKHPHDCSPIELSKKKSSKTKKSQFIKNETSLLAKVEEEKKDNRKEFSLCKHHKKLPCERLLEGKACQRRNVHKSIIRHMDFFIQKNSEKMTSILNAAGYSLKDINNAYRRVEHYHITQRDKGDKRMAQSIVRNILSKKSIYTYILRETLRNWKEDWENGIIGRISKKYLSIYKNICEIFYNEAVKMLSDQE